MCTHGALTLPSWEQLLGSFSLQTPSGESCYRFFFSSGNPNIWIACSLPSFSLQNIMSNLNIFSEFTLTFFWLLELVLIYQRRSILHQPFFIFPLTSCWRSLSDQENEKLFLPTFDIMNCVLISFKVLLLFSEFHFKSSFKCQTHCC